MSLHARAREVGKVGLLTGVAGLWLQLIGGDVLTWFGCPALLPQIADHVLGQHRYRAPGDDGKNGGDDRYVEK